MELPVVTQQIVDTIFQNLMGMEVELDENPLIYGPKRLNKKIAAVRQHQSECEALFLKVSLWVQKYKSASRAASLSLELGKKHLLTNDPEVRAGRNVADRDAIASMKLRDEVEEVSKCGSALSDLEAIIVVIKSKKSDLKDTQSRLKDQIRLCQEEISLGSRWGNKKYGQVEKEEPKKEGHRSVTELTQMFQEQRDMPTDTVKQSLGDDLGGFVEEIEQVKVTDTETTDTVSEEPVSDEPQLRQSNTDIDDLLDSILG